MTLVLPDPALRYDPALEAQRNTVLEREDTRNHKKGAHVELGQGEELILRSPDGTRWAVRVSDAGALSATAL